MMRYLFSLYLVAFLATTFTANAYERFYYADKYNVDYGTPQYTVNDNGTENTGYSRNYSISVYQSSAGVDRSYQAFGQSSTLPDSTTFVALQDASLVMTPYAGLEASGVDFSIDVVSADGTSTGANIYEKTDAKTGTTYVAGSEGHLGTTGTVGFSAGEMVALTASYFDGAGQLVTDTLTSTEVADMAANPELYNAANDSFFAGKTGWYTRLLYGTRTIGDTKYPYNYRDVFFVKDGVIVASFEALPEVQVAAAGNQISGQPLPGVLASLAALGLIGGIAKRRKMSA